MRKLSHHEIVQRQVDKLAQTKLPFCVLLNNIRSLHNVGSIFRTADGVGLEKIWLCGITGYPPQSQIAKTALGAEQRVPWEHQWDAISVIKNLKQEGCQIVLLEQTEESISHDEFSPKFPICLVIGHEITGVSDELVSLCDAAVEIDMAGMKNSLNVAVAFGIVAYQFRTCFKNGAFHGFADARAK